MKSILFISAYFHPQNAISVARVGEWVKYLSMEGYKIDVLTTKKYAFNYPLNNDRKFNSNVNVIEIDYLPWYLKFILDRGTIDKNPRLNTYRRDILYMREIIKVIRSKLGEYIDVYNLWVKPAIEFVKESVIKGKYNIMISSFNPPASHIIASKLKSLNPSIFWVADFRDLWAYNHVNTPYKVIGKLMELKEKKTIKHADLIITVSEPLSAIMREHYKGKQVITIENGFDPEEFPDWKPNLRKRPVFNGRLRIVYTGTIYEGKMDPSHLILALNRIINQGLIPLELVRVEFYGRCELELKRLIKTNPELAKYGIIHYGGFLSRKEAVEVQKSADILLFLEWGDKSAKGVITGKLFEYMVSGTPILSVGPASDSCSCKIIRRSGTGICLNGVDEIEDVLKRVIAEKRFFFYEPNIEFIEEFSRKKQIKKLISYLPV